MGLKYECRSRAGWEQGLLEHKVHQAVGAYSRPMPMSLGPSYERCGTLCSNYPCIYSGDITRHGEIPQAPREALFLMSEVPLYAAKPPA